MKTIGKTFGSHDFLWASFYQFQNTEVGEVLLQNKYEQFCIRSSVKASSIF